MYCNERAGTNFTDTTDTTGISIHQKLYIEKCNYLTLLIDRTTDFGVTEQELIYIFLNSKRAPSGRFLSNKNIKHAHADPFKASVLLQALGRLKSTNWKKKFIVDA